MFEDKFDKRILNFDCFKCDHYNPPRMTAAERILPLREMIFSEDTVGRTKVCCLLSAVCCLLS
jgi:hypothetical protein